MGISGLGLALLTLASHQVLTSLGAPAAAEATTPGKQSGEQGQVVSGVGGSAAGINGGSSSSWDKVWSPNFQDYWGVFQPAFENNSMSNVSVHAGEVAFLPCPVRFLGDRSISWIRQKDLSILTSGRSTYTSDDRFQVLHAGIADNWALQIKFTKLMDAGVYECQISTGQGIISTFINLIVLEPVTSIFGSAPERHVQLGSTITLTCVVENTSKPVMLVLWYRGSHSLNYEKNERVFIKTDTKPVLTSSTATSSSSSATAAGVDSSDSGRMRTTSTLTITQARHSDAGNYTCAARNAKSSSVTVFVSEQGDTQASMERRSNSGNMLQASLLWCIGSIKIINLLISRIVPR